MSEFGNRIPELPRATTGIRFGVYPKWNPIAGRVEQVAIQHDLGATRASMDWNAATTYVIDDYVLYQGLTAWKSLQNGNQGNIPTENSFWTQVSISEADGITDTQYASGLFTYQYSKVVVNNVQYYLQETPPFFSSNFATELLAGNWATGVDSTQLVTVNSSTYTVTSADLIIHVTYTQTGICNITIPTSMITNGFRKLVIKDGYGNASVNNIVIQGEGGELIDGDTSVIVDADYSALNLYAISGSLFIY